MIGNKLSRIPLKKKTLNNSSWLLKNPNNQMYIKFNLTIRLRGVRPLI